MESRFNVVICFLNSSLLDKHPTGQRANTWLLQPELALESMRRCLQLQVRVGFFCRCQPAVLLAV